MAIAAALASAFAVAGVGLTATPASAADFVRIGTWDYPADLHDLAVDTLGQTFEVGSGQAVNVVGGVFANYGMSGSGFTMTLKATGPSGAVIAEESYANIRDNAWVELELDATLDPGTYYLEASDVVGLVAWWSNTPNVYADGTAYRNGSSVSGDRTIVTRNNDPVVVPPPPAQPGFVDGVADGITIEPQGIEIRRDDQSGFAYDYAPSVIVENGIERAWWCGHNVNGDGVYYAERTQPDGQWSTPELVVRADQAWEVVHVCDPSVVRGEFTVEGTDYDYMMLYGAADISGQNTKLGSAFSTDGITWHKHLDEALLEEPGMIYDYGVGMPALFAHEGSTYVAYYDTGRNSATIVREVLTDGSLAPELVMLPFSSGDTFADLAFSEAEQRWYATTKAQRGGLSDEESYVYVSRTDDLATTEWVHLGIVGEYLTGYPQNHNAGWYRNADGSLYEPSGVKTLMFGAQDGGQGTWDPDKWDLGTVTISGAPTGGSVPDPFSLSTPADGADLDPLDIDGFTWAAADGATSYTLRIGEDPSLSSETVALATTVHSTSVTALEHEYAIGSTTQRMALLPGKTYYWNVTAVSPGGTTLAQTVPRSFETTPDYDLALTPGGYVPWQVIGDASFTPGSPALLDLPTAESGLRTGADYNPTRIAIGELSAIELEFAPGSAPAALGDLVIGYRLQSDARDTPDHVTQAPIATNLVGDTLTIDQSGQPGWGVAGEQIAQLTIRTTVPGTLSLERISVVDTVAAPVDDESEAPGVATVSTTSGWETGLHDGRYDVRVDLWWGSNASRITVFENGTAIHAEELVPETPAAQSLVLPVRDRGNGEYVYTARLENSKGATDTAPVTVTVRDAAPGRPALSHDHHDGIDDFTVRGDLWWGTNATAWRLLENDHEVASGELAAASPAAQRVEIPLTDRPAGRNTYELEFVNAAGSTRSTPVTIDVAG